MIQNQPANTGQQYIMIIKHNVREHIKTASKRNLILPAAVLLAAVLLFWILPVKNAVFPRIVSGAQEITSAAEKRLHITINDLHYCGYDVYISKKIASSYYYYLDDDGACMFFLIPAAESENFTGVIETYSGNVIVLDANEDFDEFISGFSGDIGWSEQSLRDVCKDRLYSASDYHLALYTVTALLLAALALVCIAYMVINLIIFTEPSFHPAARRLRRFGLDGEDFSAIDEELKDPIICAGDLYTTDHFFVAFTKRNIYIAPLFNIIWAYKYARRIGNSKLKYSLVIVTSPKDTMVIPGNKKADADMILRFFRRDFTHIKVGYTEEIHKEMEKYS